MVHPCHASLQDTANLVTTSASPAPRFRRGLVPLSADPITYGHLDLIRAAREQCDELVVLIADNDLKRGSYCFKLGERAAFAKHAIMIAGLRGVHVVETDQLLVDMYLREGCDAIFRGVRNEEDRTSDVGQMRLHGVMLPGIAERVVYVPALDTRAHVSSTMVKAFVNHDVDVAEFVPIAVKQALEERIRGQFRIGITGCIASGKSFIARHLAAHVRDVLHVPATHIDVDSLQRELYDEDTRGAQEMRDAIGLALGTHVLSADGRTVCRDRIAKALFDDGAPAGLRHRLHAIVAPHIHRKLREAFHVATGLVVIEWAQLAEMQVSHWTNHHVIVVDTPDRDAFASERGLSRERLAALATLQWSADEKVRALEACTDTAQSGSVLRWTNRRGEPRIPELAETVLRQFPELHRRATS